MSVCVCLKLHTLWGILYYVNVQNFRNNILKMFGWFVEVIRICYFSNLFNEKLNEPWMEKEKFFTKTLNEETFSLSSKF